MKPYYYVYRVSYGLAPKVRHATIAQAQAEAERLASQHPGEAFEILKCIGFSEVKKPVKTFWLDEASDNVPTKSEGVF